MMFSKTVVRVLLAAALVAPAVTAQAVTIDMVTVGNAGNAADTTTNGAVDYEYQIGKYEVTVAQYTEFLNAVARTDAYGLWETSMENGTWGGIQRKMILRTGSAGSYSYASGTPTGGVAGGWNNRPVAYVDWGDAARFCNWLTNGKPTTGEENASTTEEGSYMLDGAIDDATLADVMREENAVYVLPNADEWYKAAYHKNDGVTANY
jgi:formylglycine-generating enzyme